MKRLIHKKNILLILLILALTPKPTSQYFQSSKLKINFLQMVFKENKKDHEHCKKYDPKDFKFPTWKISQRNSYLNKSFIKKHLLSEEKYFPIGNYKDNSVHSGLSKAWLTFILIMTLLSILSISLVFPCPCWSQSWIRVLRNPYGQYSFVNNEDDNIKDKQKMVKIQKRLESMIVLKLATFFKKICILFMFGFFSLTLYILNSNNFGEKPECGLVESIYEMFEGKKTPFLKQFGMVSHRNFLDDFLSELEDFKHEMEGFDKIMKIDFGSDSRVIHNRFKDFYNNYKSYKIRSCSPNPPKSHEFIAPFHGWVMHNPKYLNYEIEREVKEIVKFGHHIHKAAFNMKHMKDKEGEHIQKFRLALIRFKDHILAMNHNFFNYYEGVLQKFKDFIKRTKVCSYVIGISMTFYMMSLAVPRHVIRTQVSLGFFCSAVLLWNGLKLYSEVIYRTKGCLAADGILNNKYDLDDYLVPKEELDLNANSLYDWSANCIAKGAEGDIENVISGRRKEELEYGLSILRGMSHNLSFLEESSYEPKAFKYFAGDLNNFKIYHKMRGMGFAGLYLDDASRHLMFMNSLIRCTKNYFVFSEKYCRKNSKVFKNSDSLMYENEGDYCIPLQKYQHLVLTPRYKGTCVKEEDLEKLQSQYNGLRKCTQDRDRLAQLMVKDFEEIREHVRKYLKKFKEIEGYYKKNRNKFKKSIKSFEDQNLTLSGVMNCRHMSGYVRMAYGNACYDDFNVKLSMLCSLFITISGLILLVITMLRLAEVVRFWASKGNKGLGIELGGV